MEYNNKTILIVGLVICSVIALILDNHDVALAITAGLVGYLSKDNKVQNIEPTTAIDEQPLNAEYEVDPNDY